MEQNNKRYLIIYHREDNDGVFSGALLDDYLMRVAGVSSENITLIGADYNMMSKFEAENTPKSLHKKYDSILLTDISFGADYMQKLFLEFRNSLVWCDHHAPIIAASGVHGFSECPGVRQTDRSAILCVWKYLYDQFDEAYSSKDIPNILRILSAYDSWTYEAAGFDFEYVRAVNRGVGFTFNLDFTKVLVEVSDIVTSYKTGVSDVCWKINESRPCDTLTNSMFEVGSIITRHETQENESLVNTVGDCDWHVIPQDGIEKRSACALFRQGGSSSVMFSSVSESVLHGIVFKRQRDGKWTISLYNTKNDSDFHCGEFLRSKYGGGGHKGAAGCTVSEETFIGMLRTKSI